MYIKLQNLSEMYKIVLKLVFCLLLITSLTCKKDSKSLDDMILEDGMMVFRLDGKDWIVRDVIASYSDVAEGEMIAVSASVMVSLDTYISVALLIMDTETVGKKDYTFIGNTGTGSKIEIDEGETTTTGKRYLTTNPDDASTGTGKITVLNYDLEANTISGSFSGEIFKTSYSENTDTGWAKTSIKSGRFSNVPVIIGK